MRTKRTVARQAERQLHSNSVTWNATAGAHGKAAGGQRTQELSRYALSAPKRNALHAFLISRRFAYESSCEIWPNHTSFMVISTEETTLNEPALCVERERTIDIGCMPTELSKLLIKKGDAMTVSILRPTTSWQNSFQHNRPSSIWMHTVHTYNAFEIDRAAQSADRDRNRIDHLITDRISFAIATHVAHDSKTAVVRETGLFGSRTQRGPLAMPYLT